MIEVHDYPPIIDRIVDRFGPQVKRPGVLFAWGEMIFNPGAVEIKPQLLAHEYTHGQRQGDDIEAWWDKYLNDPKFMLEEEILAHQVELMYLQDHAHNRIERRVALKKTARRLASPLYGNMVSFAKAKKVLAA